jgi:hypothetical protein
MYKVDSCHYFLHVDCHVVKKMPKSKDEKILKDEVVMLSDPNKAAPELMRRVVALVEIDVPLAD